MLGCTGPAPALPRSVLRGVGRAVSHCTDGNTEPQGSPGACPSGRRRRRRHLHGRLGLCGWVRRVGGAGGWRGWGGQQEALGSTREEHSGRGAVSGEPRVAPRVEQRPLGAHCAHSWGTPSPQAGRGGLPHLAQWPQFPRGTSSAMCPSPFPEMPQALRPDGMAPAPPARISSGTLFTLLPLLSLSHQRRPHTPKPACVGRPLPRQGVGHPLGPRGDRPAVTRPPPSSGGCSEPCQPGVPASTLEKPQPSARAERVSAAGSGVQRPRTRHLPMYGGPGGGGVGAAVRSGPGLSPTQSQQPPPLPAASSTAALP